MKKGFTLIEVLLTLSILGVIAAITIPMLNANITKKETETSFARTVSLFENANTLLMNEKDVPNLDEAVGTEVGKIGDDESLKYIETIADYLNFRSGINNKTTSYTDFSYANEIANFPENDTNLYISESGSLAMFPMEDEESEEFYLIYIDLNGVSKKPNALGRDVQAFSINRSTGKVYGAGSKRGGWKAGESENLCSSNVEGAGEFCAGSIMDNDGKITYKW